MALSQEQAKLARAAFVEINGKCPKPYRTETGVKWWDLALGVWMCAWEKASNIPRDQVSKKKLLTFADQSCRYCTGIDAGMFYKQIPVQGRRTGTWLHETTGMTCDSKVCESSDLRDVMEEKSNGR